ncbi:deoxyuridine 5'-triphosphate nucleotidohydrolase [Hafnia phage yong3]|nr:deoxyuridine 5'-triphosphate nucleotidohydrolase [Hafnia phage yong3]
MIDLKVQRVTDTAILPVFGSKGAACFDLHADVKSDGCTVKAIGINGVIRTGLKFEIPEGYAMLVYSRSGHGFKHDIRLANCVGIIDSDYRGEVMVKLTNDHGKTFMVEHGDRIAQAMLIPVPAVQFLEVSELTSTERGEGGFGSTGMGTGISTKEEVFAAMPIMTSVHLNKK